MGVGSLQFVTPVYVTEIAPVRVRGLLLMLYNFWYVSSSSLSHALAIRDEDCHIDICQLSSTQEYSH